MLRSNVSRGVRATLRPLPLAMAFVALTIASFPSGALAQDEAAKLELTTESDAARQHFMAGMHDMFNVHQPRAAMHFEMALEADPDLALAKVLHGFTAPGLNGAERQARVAEGVAALGGASANEMLVGVALQNWMSGNAPAASHIFATASELMPGDPYLASWATQLAGARGDQTDPVARWQALADAFPELPHAYNSMAYAQHAQGDEADAFASVRKYVELAPDHPNAADSHAEMLQHAGRLREAWDEYARAAELDPDYSQAYVGRAEVMVIVGDMESAREELAQAIEHAPDANARFNFMRAMGHTYMLEGSRDGAIGQFQQAAMAAEEAGNDGSRGFALASMALVDGLMGDGRFIAEYLEESAAANGAENAGFLAISGLAYGAAGDAAMAREASGKLMETSSSSFWQSMGHNIAALASLAEDDAEGALAHLDMADPGNPVTQALMADTYERMERPRAAGIMRMNVVENRQINVANPWWAFARVYVGTDD